MEHISSDSPSYSKTEGDFVYRIEKDYSYVWDVFKQKYHTETVAFVENYIGNDRNVVIPSTLGGYRVYDIDPQAFAGFTTIDTLTFSEGIVGQDFHFLSDTLREIGCSVKTINLPSTWQDHEGFFYCLTGEEVPLLQAINISENHPTLCSINGVVYSKDQSRLICYPPNKLDSTFTVPSGVTIIEKNAFDCPFNLQVINISDSVQTVKDENFYNAYNLTTINLGKNVQNLTGLSIVGGANYLKDNGMPTFCLDQVNVDPANPYFTSENGVLYNKDKSEIVYYPISKTSASFTAPNSVIKVGEGAFGSCVYLNEIIFPSQIIYLGESAFNGTTHYLLEDLEGC